jgi:phosphatidate cytidylyltransferase
MSFLRYSDGDDGSGPIDRDELDFDVLSSDEPKGAAGVTITGAHQVVQQPTAAGAPTESALDDWSFVKGTSPDPDLPPWTDAPTGQVPAVLAREEDAASSDDPWSSLPGPTWREDETDWAAHEDTFEPAMLGNEGGTAPVHEDEARRPWEFDSGEEAPEAGAPQVDPVVAGAAFVGGTTTAHPASRVRARNSKTRKSSGDSPLTGRTARPASGRDMPMAIITGLVLAIVVLIIFNVSTVLSAVLAAAVVTLAAGEAYAAFRHAGHRPAAALGLIASLALMVAAYNKGEAALPLVTALVFFFSFLWFLTGVEHAEVVDGVSTTLLVYIWVGVLGSFAGLLLAPSLFPDHHGVHFLLGAIILVVANDVGALFTGKALGRHPLAPAISPNKTWEGAVGGTIVTLLAGFVVSAISGWTLGAAMTLAIAASVLAPLGDLCESMFKRSLGLKDMGRLLPGHGGLLDRLDGLLFVLPATYYTVLAFHLS